ncbi:yipf6 [Acrasis kona]|uniref:Protein YIPF n=1 Tax=Acrasis kona TaxID=1008807 RepID=A0AAW2ZC27_9EUKA
MQGYEPVQQNNVQQSNSNTYNNSLSSTLEEPVYETIWRDVKAIGLKVRIVLVPFGNNLNALRDWDLWGPLLMCLTLALVLGAAKSTVDSAAMFAGVFVVVWIGSSIVTLNGQLLGGTLSFFMSLCVLGYCVFPLVVCSIIFYWLNTWYLRLMLVVPACGWSCFASTAFLSGSVPQDRKALSMFPIGLFYVFISWLVLSM